MKGFGPWHVVSVIETSKGEERRLMRKALSKWGAEGWARFYGDLMSDGLNQNPMIPIPAGFRHYYVVERAS